MKETFLKTGYFQSDAVLRTLFVTQGLYEYKHSIPDATSPKERVEKFIKWAENEEIIDIFIDRLMESINKQDGLYYELQALKTC